MSDDAEKTLKELATRLWALPIGDYLGSVEFSRFARDHDLYDIWREYLRVAEDRPDLYGNSVTRSAFSLFLYHIFHRRREEFLSLFAGLLADFSRGISCTLPVDDIKPFLLLLGYTEGSTDHALFSLRIQQTVQTGMEKDCCPPKKKV